MKPRCWVRVLSDASYFAVVDMEQLASYPHLHKRGIRIGIFPARTFCTLITGGMIWQIVLNRCIQGHCRGCQDSDDENINDSTHSVGTLKVVVMDGTSTLHWHSTVLKCMTLKVI